ncbi:MAG: TIGR04283 family arsenosugar biosynthesis glycosyltransferase [Gammaproteobacteria bacterium]|nr:TIGR04283 family arsenosugar biosynthesis glycosyltransferase [Gammaproteobacteria bacterium]MBU1444001.1 TIGR04283 family arsenosugar biosynthesis glycosyltransferase [Gammaproteobacteria bacterium]
MATRTATHTATRTATHPPTHTATHTAESADTGPSLGIIVPVLDEAASLEPRLCALQPFRERGSQLVVVDGGSADDSLAIGRAQADLALVAPRGRGAQMNAGAAACQAELLLFLHADTVLPANADALVRQALQQGAGWGRFDVRIDSPQPAFRMIELMMNLRSRWTGMATGDQAMFVRADLFRSVGGFADIALMEDIALSLTLRRTGRPACLRDTVTTSARRWERNGVWRTLWLMWRLRAAYALGADPARLALKYGYRPRPP